MKDNRNMNGTGRGNQGEGEQCCPCCGRHCSLSELHCDCGREYVRTGVAVEKRQWREKNRQEAEYSAGSYKDNCEAMDEEGRLVSNLRSLCHSMRFLFGGKGGQKRVLSMLHESGGMTQRELTERMEIQPGSASEVIGKLEGAGFIVRASSQTDRRTTNIKLTEEGEERAKEAIQEKNARCREMFSCLTQEEKAALLTLTEKLNADWNQRYKESAREDKRHDHGHHGHHCEKSRKL